MSTKRSYKFALLEIFRKHYCPFCGKRLEKKRKITILHKGDKGFSRVHMGVGWNPFIDENEIITYYFNCNTCNEDFSEYEVDKIRKLQKKEKSKVLKSYTRD